LFAAFTLDSFVGYIHIGGLGDDNIQTSSSPGAGSGNDIIVGDTGSIIAADASFHFDDTGNFTGEPRYLLTKSFTVSSLVNTTWQSCKDTIRTQGGNDLVIAGNDVDSVETGASMDAIIGDHGTITVAGALSTIAWTIAVPSYKGAQGNDILADSFDGCAIIGGGGNDQITIQSTNHDQFACGDYCTITLVNDTFLSMIYSPVGVFTDATGMDTITVQLIGADDINATLGIDIYSAYVQGGLRSDTIYAEVNGRAMLCGDDCSIIYTPSSTSTSTGAASELSWTTTTPTYTPDVPQYGWYPSRQIGNDIIWSWSHSNIIAGGFGADNLAAYPFPASTPAQTESVAYVFGDESYGYLFLDQVDKTKVNQIYFYDSGYQQGGFSNLRWGNDTIVSQSYKSFIYGGLGSDTITCNSVISYISGDYGEIQSPDWSSQRDFHFDAKQNTQSITNTYQCGDTITVTLQGTQWATLQGLDPQSFVMGHLGPDTIVVDGARSVICSDFCDGICQTSSSFFFTPLFVK
jgi:hypothetical protein